MSEDFQQSLNTADRPAISVAEFRSLDPRVIRLWRLTNLVSSLITLLVMLIGVGVVWLRWPSLLPIVFTLWILLAAFSFWYSYWHPSRSYRAWGYRIDSKVLETQSGIIFRVTQLLPLTRLQHVDLERGPFERIFGLSSLVLYTAGTRAGDITIPGLDADEAVLLRDHLLEVGGYDAV
jgi:uncharacterized protein